MKNKTGKFLYIVFLSLIVCAFFSIISFAAVPRITGIGWDDATATAFWDVSGIGDDEYPTYRITLYRGERKRMSSTIRTKEDSYCFASIIADRGTGRYYVEISIAGVDMEPVESEELVVDGSVLGIIKKYAKQKVEAEAAAAEAGRFGWISYPADTWKYKRSDGTFVTGWFLDNGNWYYLADNGVMLTGWQIINNRWYYLSASGAMLANTITPDGVQVNAKGEAVANGVPLDASWQPKNTTKNAAKTLTELETIRINSTETKVNAGVVRPMRVTSSGKFTVENYSFSKPYELWKPGEKILVTCVIDAYTGYAFTDRTRITFNRGTLVSNEGNAVERTVIYEYYPRLVLDSPANVFLDSSDVLHWTAVPNASKYQITVILDDERQSVKTVSGTYFDLSGYLYEGKDVQVELTAIASESLRNYWYDSFATKITDPEAYRPDGTVTYVGKRLKYYDADGNAVEGWAEINGSWYHFTKGLSEPAGWFLDADKFWYYFDENSRMKTGDVTENGMTFFLNDGSIKDIPLGAWVEGR